MFFDVPIDGVITLGGHSLVNEENEEEQSVVENCMY